MSSRARLLFFGMLLFAIGIVSGTVAQLLPNPRLALSGHLEGLLNGMFLMIVGLLWDGLALGARAKTTALLSLLIGSYANWALTMLGALWGTKKLTPIAGAGYSAAAWQEGVVSVGLVAMILTMLCGVGLLLWGLRHTVSDGTPRGG